MTSNEPITIPIQGPSRLGASTYFEKVASTSGHRETQEPESKLLKALKLVLKGSSAVESDRFYTTSYMVTTPPFAEEQLSWNLNTVVLSSGGIIQKRWTFHEDDQAVQWACLGWLAQPPKTKIPPSGPAHFTAATATTPPDPDEPKKPIFGPYHLAREKKREVMEPAQNVRGVFVFFRTMGKIFLTNGTEYTFPLPFVTRRAWPVAPHGVLIQRSVDRTELAEAEASGEPILPTIFSLVNPLGEATPVGVTSGIIGGFHRVPVSLKDEQENFEKPQRSINSKEIVVGVPQRVTESEEDVIVTYSPEDRRITIWRYAYLEIKDTPVPLQVKDRKGKGKSPDTTQTQEADSGLQNPGEQKTLGSASTMADIMAAISSQKAEPPKPKEPERKPKPKPKNKPKPRPAENTPANDTGTPTKPPVVAKMEDEEWKKKVLDRALSSGPRADYDAIPPMHGRGTTPYWAEKLYMEHIPGSTELNWSNVTVSIFDQRFDGRCERSLVAICIPDTEDVLIFSLTKVHDPHRVIARLHFRTKGISIASILATRAEVLDLLVLKSDNQLTLLTHGVHEVAIRVTDPLFDNLAMNMSPPPGPPSAPPGRKIVSLRDSVISSVELLFDDQSAARVTIRLYPNDTLTKLCLKTLTLTLPVDYTFALHRRFLQNWSTRGFSSSDDTEFECFVEALFVTFGMEVTKPEAMQTTAWDALLQSSTHASFREDPVMRILRPPAIHNPGKSHITVKEAHILLAPILNGLHHLGEELRLDVTLHASLIKLVPVICCIAEVIRPEWADYWRRLCPTTSEYPVEHPDPKPIDDRLPVWPSDMTAILYGRIHRPDWKVQEFKGYQLAVPFNIAPAYIYGQVDPLMRLRRLTSLYMCLADDQMPNSRIRAENAMSLLVSWQSGKNYTARLPLGVASPLEEAARSCQLSPPKDWPAHGYRLIGRNDLAEQQSSSRDALSKNAYKPPKYYLDRALPRKTYSEVEKATLAAVKGETQAVTGVELDLEDFTDVRFGNDRRLEEVAHMLNTSKVTLIKVLERPDFSDYDRTKECQHQVGRVGERILATPCGRAIFTYASSNEAKYVIPKMEYTVRVLPDNTVFSDIPNKVAPECGAWADFHNGVAAALRISPTCTSIDSSWIASNRPSIPNPEHGGFLLGLGLNGHLTHVKTWDLFSYLTPKHEHTSIGMLLGLCASHVGTGNEQITKILSLHAPSLLIPNTEEMNVPLPLQTAGVAGLGLLYLGTAHRHSADVCLELIGSRDKSQANLSSEHRESFTLAAGMSFGMIMLGKGSTIPADIKYLERLQAYIRGEHGAAAMNPSSEGSPIVNLTAAPATIALGLTYLKTGRQDIADIIRIPDTVLDLRQTPPSLLVIRTIARCLIMWNNIEPSQEWVSAQIPVSIIKGMHNRSQLKRVDESVELAYYNILAGCCFAVALKFAGTAREQAYGFIATYYDLFTRNAIPMSHAYQYRIRKSTLRDGLNLISISLGMVLAGTGEVNCMRRLRHAYGVLPGQVRYASYVATTQALGLLFLGGGRYTLGTSDAAIACMVAAFYPRYPAGSHDNKSYMQAMRHLWALAAEPRCLIPRDVDTREVVYMPIKVKVKDRDSRNTKGEAIASLIAPTLIPDLDEVLSVRVDTPRYWPFNMDLTSNGKGLVHREALLRDQTLYVKRRTAFLSYTEDPKGSRSLFVRSGSTTADAGTLDFPKLSNVGTHPSSDLSQIITSYSNDVLFLAFADHFCRDEGDTPEEQLFTRYCRAALMDGILQDKPNGMQSHLTLYHYRTMSHQSQFFSLWLQDLTFVTNFYGKVFDRWFSGRSENNARPPLLRESTTSGAMYELDGRLETVRGDPAFMQVLTRYAQGEDVWAGLDAEARAKLAWYLLRSCVPVSSVLVTLKQFARAAHETCAGRPWPEGTDDVVLLDEGIKQVLYAAGSGITYSYGSVWATRSLDEVVRCWQA
ncbi:hypothetical protein GLOTRDRAFT_138586 [Gloeophyllum trabeum ATCC 11539]|uniref:Uncharacterized protein n=1 Tax=Gloeophyllum trabeum (strain ATCC 11539 / FP-39264 / Madison 617) TaxID=670483 RepID=S7RMW7_GLOTA|nr:uncharacterized protein GLOTRDRAFT_138586 [Gloeophyllum trabeum ATCC 11539]EPQ55810.1 hypothetical protein GLOTRDRAFT_138586 [Gloeophyllum trabeum ATCC 11539]